MWEGYWSFLVLVSGTLHYTGEGVKDPNLLAHEYSLLGILFRDEW